MGSLRERSFPAACILIGWVLSRVGFSLLRGTTLGPVAVLPGFLWTLAWLFVAFAALASGRRPRFLAALSAGVLADSLAYWLYRPGTGSPLEIAGAWDGVVVWPSVAALLVLVAFASAMGPKEARGKPATPPAPVTVLAAGLVALLTVAAFRIAYALSADVPNEERSLMVGGVEVHHAWTATVVLLAISLLLAIDRLRPGPALLVVYGIVAGSILDQCMFLSLTETSDLAYDGAASRAGAAVGAGLFSALTLALALRIQRRPDRSR